MKTPAIPANETERLKALYSYEILDTQSEEIFDNITWLAAIICGVHNSLITLIDKDRQWVKSSEGKGVSKEISRNLSFCGHAINHPSEIFEISDASKDVRFADNPLVTGIPYINFYAGVPLVTEENQAIGVLCVLDDKPKELTPLQREMLQRLSKIVMGLLEARKATNLQFKERLQAEEVLKEASTKLRENLHAMEQRNREMSLLSETTGILQACLSVEEANFSLAAYCKQLFPRAFGSLSLIKETPGQFQTMMNWGNGTINKKLFNTNDCWALRRGQPYKVEDSRKSLMCKHIVATNQGTAVSSLCVPMMAQGETIGLLCLEFHLNNDIENDDPITENVKILATTLGEQSALALANIKLREKLSFQSTSDALTGLSNRRHLEMELEHVFEQAEANNSPVSLVLLDIDHFKKINDTYGHDIGDIVLQRLAQVFKEASRKRDIVCRLGGDEFVLVYPDMAIEKAFERAELIRRTIFNFDFDNLDQVTVSLGIAVYPDHGTDAKMLFQEADKALYRAKETRNKTSVAPVGKEPASKEKAEK